MLKTPKWSSVGLGLLSAFLLSACGERGAATDPGTAGLSEFELEGEGEPGSDDAEGIGGSGPGPEALGPPDVDAAPADRDVDADVGDVQRLENQRREQYEQRARQLGLEERGPSGPAASPPDAGTR